MLIEDWNFTLQSSQNSMKLLINRKWIWKLATVKSCYPEHSKSGLVVTFCTEVSLWWRNPLNWGYVVWRAPFEYAGVCWSVVIQHGRWIFQVLTCSDSRSVQFKSKLRVKHLVRSCSQNTFLHVSAHFGKKKVSRLVQRELTSLFFLKVTEKWVSFKAMNESSSCGSSSRQNNEKLVLLHIQLQVGLQNHVFNAAKHLILLKLQVHFSSNCKLKYNFQLFLFQSETKFDDF